jgi:ketosteroid isomerase-like protein
MYHFIVKQKVKVIFEHLNQGDFDYVLRQFAPSAEHWFSGRHALAGLRRTPQLRQAWYQRLKAVLPGLRFDVQKIVVSGWPWRTHVAVEWKDRVFDPQGIELSPNQGMFMLTLSWGRAVEFHVYCDTQGLAQNLDLIAEQGVAQASLPPLTEAA